MMKRPLFAVCLTIVLSMMLYLRIHPPTVFSYKEAVGEEVCLSGLVYAKEYQKGPNGPVLVLYLVPDKLRFQNQNIPFYNNFICVLQNANEAPFIGSTIAVTGTLYEYEEAVNPGQFDAKQYYQTMGISAKLNGCRVESTDGECHLLKEMLWELRCMLGASVEAVFDEDVAAFFKSMFLGDKSELDIADKQLYKEAGILHILAISGLHISMLGMGFYKLLRKIYMPVVPAAILSGIVMILYGMMAGLPVSALRAISMFLLRLGALCTGRTYDMPTALALCAAGMLLENPLYLYHAGFLLSFCAVAGVCIMKPALMRTDKEAGRFEDAILTSLSVTLMTMPLQLYFYFEVSVYSLLWNLAVIPLAGFFLGSGMLAVSFLKIMNVFHLMHPLSAIVTQIPAMCATGIFWFYKTGSTIVSKLPGNCWRPGKPETWQLVLYAAVVLLVLFLTKLQPKYKFGLFCGAILFLGADIRTGMEITFLDVGQGDCVCIQLPDGSNWLYDGGSSDVFKVGEYRIEPYLKHEGIETLDAVFLSHGDIDHIGGIVELLQRNSVEIRLLILPYTAKYDLDSGGFLKVLDLSKEKKIPILWLKASMEWQAGEVVADCLHPAAWGATEDTNASSEVICMEYGGFSLLLTGDIGMSEEAKILDVMAVRGITEVTVLKVPHHGSKYSCSEELLRQIAPKVSVISCGVNNVYGHPHQETLERISESGSVILSTPECGAITVKVNGAKAEVSCFKVLGETENH